MNNQSLTSIALAKSGRKRSRFNMSHDVNTTADFGSVQPLMCKCVVPGTKSVLDTRSLTRLAPMVAPSFGRVKLKLWHEFVACRDICKQFDLVMSQQPTYISAADRSTYMNSVPYVPLGRLSSLVLTGARMTIYVDDDGASSDLTKNVRNFSSVKVAAPSYPAPATKFTDAVSFLASTSGIYFRAVTADSITENALNITHWAFGSAQLGLSSTHGKFDIPLGNAFPSTGYTYRDFFFVTDANGNVTNDPVSLDGADLVYEIKDSVSGKAYACAFRLSDFGKRLRKIFIGCGYQIDLSSDQQVSILPLLAYYKAYWNLFGLTQWQNYETTPLAKLVDFLFQNDLSNIVYWSTQPTIGPKICTAIGLFIRELGSCFYNDSADFVSAHLPSTAVSPVTPSNFEFIDVIANQDNVNEVNSQGTADGVPATAVNGHSFINTLEHGYLDEEYLKKLYKWTNRNTVIGRKIAEVMRAQGLGKYMDSCKTDFIGYTDDIVTISDVVATTDNKGFSGSPSSGTFLGEYGGRGLQFTQSKSFSYENDEFGFWVTLCCIVPDSGYMQQLDKSVCAVSKFQFYNAEFDSMGFEANRKNVVQGASDWSNIADGSLAATFGFAPRYFSWKFAQNVNNGDITLRSERDTYLPYTLDKYIAVNDRLCQVDSSDVTKYVASKGLDAQALPDATFINIYRSIGKYAWFGNYNRIFANNVDLANNSDEFLSWTGDTYSISLMPYFIRTSENFLIHNIFNYTQYAPMLAVEDSFETHDEDEKPDMSVKKA